MGWNQKRRTDRGTMDLRHLFHLLADHFARRADGLHAAAVLAEQFPDWVRAEAAITFHRLLSSRPDRPDYDRVARNRLGCDIALGWGNEADLSIDNIGLAVQVCACMADDRTTISIVDAAARRLPQPAKEWVLPSMIVCVVASTALMNPTAVAVHRQLHFRSKTPDFVTAIDCPWTPPNDQCTATFAMVLGWNVTST